MHYHKTIRVAVGELEADIDEDIAPLIKECWKANIHTNNSCQEIRPGIVWIEFMYPFDAERFLNIVAGPHSDDVRSLYNRIRQAWVPEKGELTDLWEYAVHVTDLAIEQHESDEGIEEIATGSSEFTFSISMRFPRSDLPVLLERMVSHNRS